MQLYWVPEFEIGNEYVDLQHRYFLDLINRIGKILRETSDDGYRKKLIHELQKYAEFHFSSEENIATSIGLSGVKDHHRLHIQLIEDLNQYAINLDSKLKTVDEFIEFITDWFLVHPQHEDRNFFKKKK